MFFLKLESYRSRELSMVELTNHKFQLRLKGTPHDPYEDTPPPTVISDETCVRCSASHSDQKFWWAERAPVYGFRDIRRFMCVNGIFARSRRLEYCTVLLVPLPPSTIRSLFATTLPVPKLLCSSKSDAYRVQPAHKLRASKRLIDGTVDCCLSKIVGSTIFEGNRCVWDTSKIRS